MIKRLVVIIMVCIAVTTVLGLNQIVSGIQTVATIVSDDDPFYTTSNNALGTQDTNNMTTSHTIYNPGLMKNNFLTCFFLYIHSSIKISNLNLIYPLCIVE